MPIKIIIAVISAISFILYRLTTCDNGEQTREAVIETPITSLVDNNESKTLSEIDREEVLHANKINAARIYMLRRKVREKDDDENESKVFVSSNP